MFSRLTGALLVVGVCNFAVANLQVPLDISEHANFRAQTLLGAASQLPEGPQTLGGTHFELATGNANIWNAEVAAAAPNSATSFEITPNVFGVSRVYTIINTLRGTPGPAAFGEVEFIGSQGASFSYPLVGNIDVRDYFFGGFTNSISTQRTVNVANAGAGLNNAVRYDMQVIDLPSAFWQQRLITVKFRDTGNDPLQRLLVVGATADVTTLVTGDATLDGMVNIADFARVASHFNAPGDWRAGDFNSNGIVELGDFAILAANFNHGVGRTSGGTSTVPEANTTMIVELIAVLSQLRRRAI